MQLSPIPLVSAKGTQLVDTSELTEVILRDKRHHDVTAVGKTWSKSCDFYNWGSLLAVGAAAEVAFCIWASFLDGQVPARTKVLFWKIMRWSFDALFAGKWPSTNWDGVPYPANSPDGRRAGHPLVGDANNYFFCCIRSYTYIYNTPTY